MMDVVTVTEIDISGYRALLKGDGSIVGKASIPYVSFPTVGVSIFLAHFIIMSYTSLNYKMVIPDDSLCLC